MLANLSIILTVLAMITIRLALPALVLFGLSNLLNAQQARRI